MNVWTMIKGALLASLSKLPPWLYAIVKGFLDDINPTAPTHITDAPDALKSWVKEQLLDAIGRMKFPFVARVLTRVVESLDGVILDFVWDSVMAQLKGLITSPSPVAALAAGEAINVDDITAEYAA